MLALWHSLSSPFVHRSNLVFFIYDIVLFIKVIFSIYMTLFVVYFVLLNELYSIDRGYIYTQDGKIYKLCVCQ